MARRVLHDRYFNLAKEKGYLARSAFKLIQLNRKHGLIRRGDRVLDLGCAPGSWVQVGLELAGPKGLVVGIDLQAVDRDFGPRARIVQGDATTIGADALLEAAASVDGRDGRLFDAVISDMAPKTTGHGDDHVSARLCERVLDVLPGLLRPGGNVVMKILEGGSLGDVLGETRRLFRVGKISKPDASRAASRETYVLGLGYRGEGAGQ